MKWTILNTLICPHTGVAFFVNIGAAVSEVYYLV